jgi:hypothetical protein
MVSAGMVEPRAAADGVRQWLRLEAGSTTTSAPLACSTCQDPRLAGKLVEAYRLAQQALE